MNPIYHDAVRKENEKMDKSNTCLDTSSIEPQEEIFRKDMDQYVEEFKSGKITINEIRKKVGLKPLEDDFGNCYFKVMK